MSKKEKRRRKESRKREVVIKSKVTLVKLISPYSHAATQREPLETGIFYTDDVLLKTSWKRICSSGRKRQQ